MLRFLLLFLLSLCAVGILGQCRRAAEQSMYLLPNRFVGNVLIVFNQPDGAPAEFRDGARLYRIPTSGVLRTQFKPNYGLHIPDLYYYVDSHGRAIKALPYFNTADEGMLAKQPTDTICFHEIPFKDGKSPENNYTSLIVGPILASETLYEGRDSTIRRL